MLRCCSSFWFKSAWRLTAQRFFFIHAHSYFMAMGKIIFFKKEYRPHANWKTKPWLLHVCVCCFCNLIWLMYKWDWIQGKPLTPSRLHVPVSVGLDDCLRCKRDSAMPVLMYHSSFLIFLILSLCCLDFAFSLISLFFAASNDAKLCRRVR